MNELQQLLALLDGQGFDTESLKGVVREYDANPQATVAKYQQLEASMGPSDPQAGIDSILGEQRPMQELGYEGFSEGIGQILTGGS